MVSERVKARMFDGVLPVPERVKTAMEQAGGSIIAIASVRAVTLPQEKFAYSSDLSYVHTFRLLDTTLKNSRDPDKLDLGSTPNITLCIAHCPAEALEKLRDANVQFALREDEKFQAGAAGTVLRHMLANHVTIPDKPREVIIAVVA